MLRLLQCAGNKKPPDNQEVNSQFVDPQGFEPRQTVPKTGVLPLHHGSLSIGGANLALFLFLAKLF